MNLVHVHLFLNHVPVVGTVFSFFFLSFGLLKKNEELILASLLSLVAVALISIPIYLTGEPAEHVVKKIAGIKKSDISNHEEAAEKSLIAVEILGALSLLGCVPAIRRNKRAPLLHKLIFSLTLVCIALFGFTAYRGGLIRHPEIRIQSAQGPPSPETAE